MASQLAGHPRRMQKVSPLGLIAQAPSHVAGVQGSPWPTAHVPVGMQSLLKHSSAVTQGSPAARFGVHVAVASQNWSAVQTPGHAVHGREGSVAQKTLSPPMHA